MNALKIIEDLQWLKGNDYESTMDLTNQAAKELLELAEQLLQNSQRYNHLKTSDHWCLKRFSDTGWEYLNSDDSWDEIVDQEIRNLKS